MSKVKITSEVTKLKIRRASEADKMIASKVRALRITSGMKGREFAEMLGVSLQQFQKYEKGVNRISSGRLAALARALDVPVNYFYETRYADTDAECLQAAYNLMRVKNEQNRRIVRTIINSLLKEEAA